MIDLKTQWLSERHFEITNPDGYLTSSYDEDLKLLYISDIEVDINARKGGIGKAMLRCAKETAEEIGAEQIVASIVSRECLQAMRSVFGPESIKVTSEGTFRFECPLDEAVDTSALLNYIVPENV